MTKKLMLVLILAGALLTGCGHNQPGILLPPQPIQAPPTSAPNPISSIASTINDGLKVTTCSHDEYGYATVDGTLRNNTSVTVTFVQLKVMLKQNGSVVDTDSTYAVGNEGLAPGETTQWEAMFSNAPTFDHCGAQVFDFDVQ